MKTIRKAVIRLETPTFAWCLLFFDVCHAVTEIKVGVILISGSGAPYDYERTAPAIDIAVEKVNREVIDNTTHLLVPIKRTYGPSCDAVQAPGIAADLYYLHGVTAFIGPGCTYALDPVGMLAGYWNVPILTGLGDSGRFKNKTNFRTLTRTAYCQCRLRKVFGSVFDHFNWTDISIIMDRDDDHALILGETLDEGLQKGGYYPYVYKYYGSNNPDYRDLLEQASTYSRIIVLSVPGRAVREFMITAYNIGFVQTGEYVFLDVELFYFPGDYWGDHSWQAGDDNDTVARAAYEALLRISLIQPSGPDFNAWSAEVKTRALQQYGFDYDANGEMVNFFVGAFYDAVVYFGQTIQESINTNLSFTDGYNFSRRMWNRTFYGITEEIYIDDNGDRDTSYTVQDMDPLTGHFHPIAYYWGDRPGYTPAADVTIHWAGGVSSPPNNVPRCGFRNDNPDCFPAEGMSPVVMALVIVLGVVSVTGTAGFFIYRKYKLEAALRDMSWVIKTEQIAKRKNHNMSRLSRMSLNSNQEIYRNQTKGMSIMSSRESSCQSPRDQIFTETGTYKGITVAIRNIIRDCPFNLNRNILIEVSKRRTLNNDNVVRFVGAVIEPPKLLVLHEYCGKGSLQDILNNDTITLDEDFKKSLISDIVKGMLYIHSSEVQSHGQLRSSNCVVDSRFVLKITDFGLPSFYGNWETNIDKIDNEHQYYEKFLWRCPEHLRETMPPKGTQKGDVYSFGIMLEEIVLRGGPFEHYRGDFCAKEIIMKVKKIGGEPFRPFVPKDACQGSLRALMMQCWEEEPYKRPSFETIKQIVRNIHGGKERSLMESLLLRMEQYANNLESIVAERTNLLAAEQAKTEQLLLQILPQTIAEQLKKGQHVQPESFESATIYFSDIVGFTTISAQSSPMDVVNLLNDLYTAFDSTLEKFDVYKVETIGDAYMVASGLPVRNGDKHAGEIACMSLALLQSIGNFRIRHMPNVKLKLRIGLHSGPCVAGVVGLKMPRYCLFGDTVNTASRMESHGEALKIHLSPTTNKLLEVESKFLLEPRGVINVKGKGEMLTHWLLGLK